MKFNGKVKILDKKNIQEDVFQILVERPIEIIDIKPGQFFNIVASKTGFPLLRRPISVSGFDSQSIEFTIKILGVGTHAMSEVKIGEWIEMMGPLGNGFNQNDEEKILMIGGGIGIAPIKSLIENWKTDQTDIDVILGYRDNPFLVEEFEKYSGKIEVVSERNPHYRKGYVTQPFLEKIDSKKYDMVYACGPEVMLKTLSKICNEKNIPIQLLMEEKMACGVGACLVCTCKTKKGEFGFKHVRMCTEGPMFYGSEVIFDED